MRIVEQAGGIVFQRTRSGTSILLVRAKRDPRKWIFPKGHVEDGETKRQTAVRETREEAGVVGEALGMVGEPLEFDYRGGRYRVQYFLIRVRSESDETDGRQKKWFAFDEAVKKVSFDGARALLDDARTLINRLPSASAN